ncbi:NmrA family NAD(P)-binding protein, partial [Steroidobacter sp.]|uniref:NmrA family NAD(P)-binding protein n=1 Tax=Steroidobacter sp. TaxID=1978227 RepID=UPI001A55094F
LTRLRPAYMLQLLFEFAPTIAQQGLIAGPFRSNPWSWVDARDVAAVAVAALKDPSHAGRIYTVTGSESLSFPQIADRLSHILGKPVRYNDITANEARGWLQGKGLSPVMIEAKLEYWDACASNMLNVPPNSVVQDVTGRPPRSLEDFVQDYKTRFLSASAA